MPEFGKICCYIAGIMRNTLDSFDRRILDIVQRDGELTADALGARVGLSPSAALRRLRRLKAEGIITATVAVVDPAAVDKPTFFVVALEIERERPELLAQLRRWFADEDQVQQVYYVTGSADFVLIITAPDVDSYDALMGRMIADNANVRRFTTNVVLGIGKRGLFVPILPPAG